MKLHRRILTRYLSCTSPVDKEGYLYKKRKKKAAYLRRWFVLKGNLLFYQERPADRHLLGVIVLEGCMVHAGQSDFSVSLVFTGPGLRSYQLAAEDQLSQKSWADALRSASHFYVSLLVRDLARLYQEAREGKSLGDSPPSYSGTATWAKPSSTVTAPSLYPATLFVSQHLAPPSRETRSYSADSVPHPRHDSPTPARSAHKRSPKHWPKRNTHVTPLNGPAPQHEEWSLLNFSPQDEFVWLHEHYGDEVKQLRAEWLRKKREEGGRVDGDLIEIKEG